jgi:hypothetical protein
MTAPTRPAEGTRRAAASGARPLTPHPLTPAPLAAPVPTAQAMMVMEGHRPHETILHDFTLEDFGRDPLHALQADHL